MARVVKDIEKTSAKLEQMANKAANVGKPFAIAFAGAIAIAAKSNAALAHELDRVKRSFSDVAGEIGKAALPARQDLRGCRRGLGALVPEPES
jgi:hypothetical protein